jgi:DNA-binding XRE family transcriptional regulator
MVLSTGNIIEASTFTSFKSYKLALSKTQQQLMDNPHKTRKTIIIRESGEKRPCLSLAMRIKLKEEKLRYSKG